MFVYQGDVINNHLVFMYIPTYLWRKIIYLLQIDLLQRTCSCTNKLYWMVYLQYHYAPNSETRSLLINHLNLIILNSNKNIRLT